LSIDDNDRPPAPSLFDECNEEFQPDVWQPDSWRRFSEPAARTGGRRSTDDPVPDLPRSQTCIPRKRGKDVRLAQTEEVVITHRGKSAGVLIGFGSEDDWFGERPKHDPAFRRRTKSARESRRRGRGVQLDDVGD
jgi:hypothetical protein